MKQVIQFAGASAMLLLASAPLSAQENTTYTYDALGRLVEVDATTDAGTDSEIDYNYDDAGNRTSQSATGGATSSDWFWLIPVTVGKMVVIPE
ncbi:RHS repeat protein [Parasphingopyxis algicola]|uniref:RHS repeat domain-containing protein n=1 Tax=Parasphingopyxis algicola TaxID=2026624 RepID=UPI0015A0CDF8|nr:RHS repeat domain-containing protein [Parasphingopyxis algicola]QLC24487.1 RHS repeat protein [Parasphingopyxis algicola]